MAIKYPPNWNNDLKLEHFGKWLTSVSGDCMCISELVWHLHYQ